MATMHFPCLTLWSCNYLIRLNKKSIGSNFSRLQVFISETHLCGNGQWKIRVIARDPEIAVIGTIKFNPR